MRRLGRRELLVAGALGGGALMAGCTPNKQATPPRRPAARRATQPFNALSFNDEGLFVLGAAGANSAEVGEVLATFDAINKRTGNPAELTRDDFDAYVGEFEATSKRLAGLAKSAADAGQLATAKYRNLRASNYMAQALFFVLGTAKPAREEQIFDSVDQSWHAALAATSPAPVQYSVQAGKYTIPVYLLRPDDSGKPRPTLVISEGSDGQNVETMQFGVVAGLERGYNVALFEGPGQMSLLFKQKLPFTPDWHEVVQPVFDSLVGRGDVAAGRVGLIGVSFGGMLCARAAARVAGLRAVVLEPAAVDMATLWEDQEDIKTVAALQAAPAAEQAKAKAEVNAGFVKRWPSLSPNDQFVIHKRSEIFTTQALEDARSAKAPSDYYGVLAAMLQFDYAADYRAITIPTLVTANQGDEFFGEAPQRAFALLEKVPDADKALVEFTTAEGAQLHDQPMAPQFAQEAIFGWLDQYMLA